MYFWLRNELTVAADAPAGWAERAGAFSYSLYLIHAAAHAVWVKLAVPSLGDGVSWLAMTLFIIAFAFGFYVVIERPSHRFARRVYGWLQQRGVAPSRAAPG